MSDICPVCSIFHIVFLTNLISSRLTEYILVQCCREHIPLLFSLRNMYDCSNISERYYTQHVNVKQFTMSWLIILLSFFFSETSSYTKVTHHGHHHLVVAVIVGVGCTFVLSILLLLSWVYWYRSHVLCTSHGTF